MENSCVLAADIIPRNAAEKNTRLRGVSAPKRGFCAETPLEVKAYFRSEALLRFDLRNEGFVFLFLSGFSIG